MWCFLPSPGRGEEQKPLLYLGGRNRVIVVAESLARVIVAIRIASVRRSSYPPKSQDLVLVGPAFVALRFEFRDWRSLV